MEISGSVYQKFRIPMRFIDSGYQSAAANMSLDEALSVMLGQRRNYSYLRFYRWQPASFSFGYNQRLERLIDLEALAKSGLGIVRRMTGGKMVFHADEHTFSLGMTAEFIKSAIGNTATFLEMFKFAIQPMIDALMSTGVPARFSTPSESARGRSNSLHCYAAAAGHSIFAGAKKLIGAAGVFRNDCLTIHGSIPISIVVPPKEVFTPCHRDDCSVPMAALKDYLQPAQIAELPFIIAKKYTELLRAELIIDHPDADEKNLAVSLLREKYSRLDWPDDKKYRQPL